MRRSPDTVTTKAHLRPCQPHESPDEKIHRDHYYPGTPEGLQQPERGSEGLGEPPFSACARQEVRLTHAHLHSQPGFPYKAGISQKAAPGRCVSCFILHVRLRSSSMMPLGIPETYDHCRERPCSSGRERDTGESSPLPQREHHGTTHSHAHHSGLIEDMAGLGYFDPFHRQLQSTQPLLPVPCVL